MSSFPRATLWAREEALSSWVTRFLARNLPPVTLTMARYALLILHTRSLYAACCRLRLASLLMGRRSVMPVALWLLLVAALLTQYPATAALRAQAPASPAASLLDFDFYRTKVEPIFLAKREGNT